MSNLVTSDPILANPVRVYWIPGCSNCLRLKSYIESRGIEYVSVNVEADQGAFEELQALGITQLPVVTNGTGYVVGFDLTQVDTLLALDVDPLARQLSGQEIVDRATRLLDGAARFALQLPPDHYNDDFPGLEGIEPPFLLPDGTALVRPDGTFFVPHRTWIALVRHIVGHGVRFTLLMQHDPSIDPMDFAKFHAMGEPPERLGIDDLAGILTTAADDIRGWWNEDADRDLPTVIDTYIGPQTLQQMLQNQTYSLAQHTRQLMEALRKLDLEPDAPIDDSVYEGLQIPAGVWN